MPSFSLARLRALVAEDGSALVASIGISAALTVAGTSVIGYSTTNQRSAKRSSAVSVASALADAGLNNALAVLSNPANAPTDILLLPPRTTTYTTGSATWSGTYDRANAVWTLSSTGSVKNPAAEADLRHTASVRVRITPVNTQPLPNDAWDYLYTKQLGMGGSCDVTVSSGVAVSSPLWVSGNLCISSGASVMTGPLVVKQRVNLTAVTSTVGTAAAPISAAHVAVGCEWSGTARPLSPICTSADNAFVAGGVSDQVIPAVTPPTADWATWFRYAAPGPFEPCTAQSGTVPNFPNQTTTFNLTPPISYSCRVGPADGPIGELSWDAASRTLTVNGTIYIRGNASAANGLVNLYAGQGTLYLSGTFAITSTTKLCARVTGTDCDFAGWDPRAAGASILTVAANGAPYGVGISIGSSSSFEGMLYATNYIQLGSSAQAKGGMVALSIMFGSGSKTYPFPALDFAPTGTPGAQFSYAHVNPPQDYS